MKVKLGALHINTDQITFAKVFDNGIEIHFNNNVITLAKEDPRYERLLDILASDFVDLGLPNA